MGEMERRKALVFVMAIVLLVLAAATLVLTTTDSGGEREPNNPESVSAVQTSSWSGAGGTNLSF